MNYKSIHSRIKRNVGQIIAWATNMKQILFVLATISTVLSLCIPLASQTRPIVDGTGAFGKALFEHLNVDPDGTQKRNIKPFVIGYCGWRLRTIAQYPITKYDGLQLGLCRTIPAAVRWTTHGNVSLSRKPGRLYDGTDRRERGRKKRRFTTLRC
jgi:hypothetical protein